MALRLAAYSAAVGTGLVLLASGAPLFLLGLILLLWIAPWLSDREEVRRRYFTPISTKGLLLGGAAFVVVLGAIVAWNKSGMRAKADALPARILFVYICLLWMAATLLEWKRLRRKLKSSIEQGRT